MWLTLANAIWTEVTCVCFWVEAFKDNVWYSYFLPHLCFRICKAPDGEYFEVLGLRMRTIQSKVPGPHTMGRQVEQTWNKHCYFDSLRLEKSLLQNSLAHLDQYISYIRAEVKEAMKMYSRGWAIINTSENKERPREKKYIKNAQWETIRVKKGT